jgi:hypothetical protein
MSRNPGGLHSCDFGLFYISMTYSRPQSRRRPPGCRRRSLTSLYFGLFYISTMYSRPKSGRRPPGCRRRSLTSLYFGLFYIFTMYSRPKSRRAVPARRDLARSAGDRPGRAHKPAPPPQSRGQGQPSGSLAAGARPALPPRRVRRPSVKRRSGPRRRSPRGHRRHRDAGVRAAPRC